MPNEILYCDRQGELNRKTYLLLVQCEAPLSIVAINSGIPIYWLRKFAAKKIPNPGVDRIQYLFEHLSGRKLNVK